jgi:hypothetical protein
LDEKAKIQNVNSIFQFNFAGVKEKMISRCGVPRQQLRILFVGEIAKRGVYKKEFDARKRYYISNQPA